MRIDRYQYGGRPHARTTFILYDAGFAIAAVVIGLGSKRFGCAACQADVCEHVVAARKVDDYADPRALAQAYYLDGDRVGKM